MEWLEVGLKAYQEAHSRLSDERDSAKLFLKRTGVTQHTVYEWPTLCEAENCLVTGA